MGLGLCVVIMNNKLVHFSQSKQEKTFNEWLFSIRPCASITQSLANTLIDERSSYNVLIKQW